MTTIIYKKIRHGYARIDKEGHLQITIPLYKKWNKSFEESLIAKGEQLLKNYNKKTHIDPIQKDNILLFGEHIPLEQFHKQYPRPKKQPTPCALHPVTQRILKEILAEYASPIIEEYSKKLWYKCKKLTIRKTSSKRGSCTYDQRLALNLDLVHLPTKYIKYVIIHEACHLKIKNHSKRFRALVESLCPNYKETKKELRKFIIRT